jgi:hypothetical protein
MKSTRKTNFTRSKVIAISGHFLVKECDSSHKPLYERDVEVSPVQPSPNVLIPSTNISTARSLLNPPQEWEEFDGDIDEAELATIADIYNRADREKSEAETLQSLANEYKFREEQCAFDRSWTAGNAVSVATSFDSDAQDQFLQVSEQFELSTVNENREELFCEDFTPEEVCEYYSELSFAGEAENLLTGPADSITTGDKCCTDSRAFRYRLPEPSVHSTIPMKDHEERYSHMIRTQHDACLHDSHSQGLANAVSCYQVREVWQARGHASIGRVQQDLQGAMSIPERRLPRYQKPETPSRNRSQISSPHQAATRLRIDLIKPEGIGEETPLKPFLRPKFPDPVPDRSPIQGLSASRLLRTCFRIGEALRVSFPAYSPTPSSLCAPNTSALAATSPTILIELYAFVASSYRSGHRQFFHFADLFFPTRPPYLSGVWEHWIDNPTFEHDGRAFLGPEGEEWSGDDTSPGKTTAATRTKINGNGQLRGQRMCRAIGTIKRRDNRTCANRYGNAGQPTSSSPGVQPTSEVTMTVLSIWQATWSDVEYVKGIVEA